MKKVVMFSALALGGLWSLSINNSVQAADVNQSQNTNTQADYSDRNVWTDQSHPRLVNVNKYINDNKLPYGGVKDESASSTFTKAGSYQNGAPEGIVIHETAKPNISAQQWADIFNNEWQSRQAYVHAIVDHTGVVQIADTNKTTWGAGYLANSRFIQVELCEENTEEEFAQSIQNYATYVAGLLHQFNLKPSLASSDGTGTIWSHHDVSRYLGGTDHTDPDGYFAWHNYSMNQFFDLIQQRYNEISSSVTKPTTPVIPENTGSVTSINEVVKITYNGAGKVALWDNYTSGKKVINYLSKNTSWKAYKVADVNGHKWYNLGGSQWVDGSYITVASSNVNNKPTTPTVPSNAAVSTISNNVKIIYSGAGKVALWNNYGNGKKVINYLSKNTTWKAYKVADVNGHKWYNLGGSQWVDGNYVTVLDNVSKPQTPTTPSNPSSSEAVNKVVTINYSGKGKVAVWNNYTTPRKTTGLYLSNGTKWKAFEVRTDTNGEKWYQLGSNQWVSGQYIK